MRPFKVGDIVVGNKNNEYGISGSKSECRIILFHEDGDMLIEVIEPGGHYIDTLTSIEKRGYRGRRFYVETKYFDLKKPLLTENE